MLGADIALGDGEEAGQTGLGGQQVVAARVQGPVRDPISDRQELAGRVEEESEFHLPEELLGLNGDRPEASVERPGTGHALIGTVGLRIERVADRGEGRPCRRRQAGQVPSVAVDGKPRRLCPADELAVRALSALGRERCHDVGQGMRIDRELGESRAPRLGRRGHGSTPVAGHLERFQHVLSRESLGSSVVADRAGGLARQSDRIADARQGSLDRERLIDHVSTGIGKGQQMARQVAAVDRRHVGRLEGLQRAGVVPVVEVPMEPREAPDRGERRFQPLDHFQRPDPTEIAGGHGRQQIHPDVRWRGPMGDDRYRILLEVVGWQRVVLWADKGLEEPPGAATDQPQRPDIIGRQLSSGWPPGWPADPSGDKR